MSTKPVLLLFGPTAVGKTDYLTKLDERIEVISADSVQVYRGLDIGSAKPASSELAAVPHHLIDVRDPREQFTVGDFLREADALVPQIAARGARAVISGGTAYYLHAYVFGLAPAPASNHEVRAKVAARLDREGLPALFARLQQIDPTTAARIGHADSYRITRALEVYEQTGKPLSSFPRPNSPRPGVEFACVGVRRPRQQLYARINRRVEEMIAAGLYDEVRGLVAAGYRQSDPGLRAIGYAEWFDEEGRLRGEAETDAVAGLIKRNSRRYAKRQMTFFARLPDVKWLDLETTTSPELHAP